MQIQKRIPPSLKTVNPIFWAAFLFLLLAIDAPAQTAKFVAQKTSFKEKDRGDMPRTLARKFKRDAARLALRLEEKKEDLRYQNQYLSE